MITKPEEIEKKSMEIIGGELDKMGISLSPDFDFIIKRVIHTTADFDFALNMEFFEKVSGLSLYGTTIITDTNMTLTGISKPGLKKLMAEGLCFMADEDVADEAVRLGVTRASVSVKKAAAMFSHESGEDERIVYAVGNAPTALMELCDQIEEGFHPRLIIAVPVGFVNVAEAKEMVVSSCKKHDIPYIVSFGRKGGSTVSAAILNALIYREIGRI